jgi:hypothetical protein
MNRRGVWSFRFAQKKYRVGATVGMAIAILGVVATLSYVRGVKAAKTISVIAQTPDTKVATAPTVDAKTASTMHETTSPAKKSTAGTTDADESVHVKVDPPPTSAPTNQTSSIESPAYINRLTRVALEAASKTGAENRNQIQLVSVQQAGGLELKVLSFKAGGSVNQNDGSTAEIAYGQIKFTNNTVSDHRVALNPNDAAKFAIVFYDGSFGHSTSASITLHARWSSNELAKPGDLLPLDVPLTPIS